MAKGGQGPIVSWLIDRTDAIEKVLRKIAPQYRIIGGEVATMADASAATQRSVQRSTEPAPAHEWAGMPPIQRTASSMPLVAAPSTFVRGLPGTQGLPPVVQQLGHEVSSMAAPGLVVARVRAVEASTSASIPAPRRSGRTAQRQAAESPVAEQPMSDAPDVVATPIAAPSTTRTTATMPVVARSAAAEAPGITAAEDEAEPARPAPEMTPVRSLPTVSRSAIRIPDRPLTSAASVVRPPVQRSHAGHSHAAPSADGGATGAPLPAPSGGMRRAASTSVISRTAMPTVSRQATPAPSTPAAPASSDSSANLPHLASPASRRGVGEPTTLPAAARPVGAAPSPVVSRSTMAGPMPLASSTLRTTIQRAADADGDEDEGEGDAPVQRSIAAPGVARTPSLPSLPVLTIARSAREDVATATATGTGGAPPTGSHAGTSGAGGTDVQRSAAAVRPIAAHNPLRPSIALQRDADDETDDGDGGDAGLPSPWWAPASDAPSGVPALPGTALGSGPAVQRSASASWNAAAASSPATPIRSPGAGPTWTNPAVQRSARPTSAAPRMPLAMPAAPSAAAAATPAPSGVPDWHAPGTTVTFPQRSTTSDAVVQTSRAAGAAAPMPTIQREGGTTSSSTTSSPAKGPSAAQSEGHSERELDELAKQLFGRIRTRLRADLLHDREASGFTFDNV